MTTDAAPAVVVDALRLARSKESIGGRFSAAELPRLGDYLFSSNGHIDYSLSGVQDERQRPLIRCIINGYLELICQRCLGPIEFRVATDSKLVLVASDKALPPPEEEDDEIDFIVGTTKLDVVQIVEDEVILSLPIAPRHADAQCAGAQQREA